MAVKVKGLLPEEVKSVAKLYTKTNKDGSRKYTQEDLASHFLVAPVTIRRALAEEGLLELKGYKTQREQLLLDYLRKHGITTVTQAKELITETDTVQNILDHYEIKSTNELKEALEYATA